ncbi:MAG: sodium/glutamate symporter [Chloroherpetonaceae bacterium]|nr:sodium/glutamate symporter [Chloroherpetonaceae bacterium]
MIKLDMIHTLAFAGLVIFLGHFLRIWIPVLAKYSIPSPVIGGLLVAFTIAFFKTGDELPIQFDNSLQTPLMIAFFASVGFSASLSLLKVGGKQVLLFFGISSLMLVIQNIIGVGLGTVLNVHPLFGLMCSSVTLAGGPATALAFAPEFEKAGMQGASVVGIAAAMLGIIFGGVIGSPIATLLIRRDALDKKIGLSNSDKNNLPVSVIEGNKSLSKSIEEESGFSLLKCIVAILLVMWVGSWLSNAIATSGATLPAYIGTMIIASIVRNLDDRFQWFRLSNKVIDDLGNAALSIFLTVALMTLKVWEIKTLALPMILIILIQTIAVGLVSYTVIYRMMGLDYDAATMSAGFSGFMLGTSANAMANMKSITDRYGAASRAFLVVPIVAAFLIDFTNAVFITFCLNLLK